MKKLITKSVFLLLTLLGVSNFACAAAGDVIFSCNFGENPNNTTALEQITTCGFPNNGFTGNQFLSADGGHDGGRAIGFHFPGHSMEEYDPFDTPAFGRTAVTVEWWERYTIPETTSNYWNTKGIRVYDTGLTSPSLGGTVSRWNGDMILWGGYGPTATLEINPTAVTFVANCDWGAAYAQNVGSNTYTTPCSGEAAYTAIRPIADTGTTWHKFRQYVKPPTSYAAQDGVVMLWKDDVLLATLSNVHHSSYVTNQTISFVRFNPSAGYLPSATEWPSFDMYFDDITIYEGYVPPGGPDTIAPASPSGLSVS